MFEVLERPMKLSADFNRAEAEAKKLLQRFGFEQPPVDPVLIARELGVRVVFVSFRDAEGSISGFYDADNQTIYVNKDEYPQRQTFTIAHELGHHVMHEEWARSSDYKVFMRDQNGPTDGFEKEANAFAAHLLVPSPMLARYQSIASVSELADLFLVSAPVIRNRMNSEARRG